MAFPNTTFVSKVTNIAATWLQAVNNFINAFPDPAGQTGKVVQSNGTNYTLVSLSAAYPNPVYYANKDFGIVNTGLVDVSVALSTLINSTLPASSTLVLDGIFRLDSTLTVGKTISLQCWQESDFLYLNMGSANDGVIFQSSSPALVNGLNGMRQQLNVFGPAACCQNAVTFIRMDRANHDIKVKAGAAAYGLRIRGALINNIEYETSGNYTPNVSGLFTPAMPLHGMLVENFGVATAAYVNVAVSGPAAPAVVTENGHGRAANSAVVFGGTGTPPSPFVLGKPYFVQVVDANHYNLSETRSGTNITSTGAGTSCQLATCSAIASNSNKFDVNLEGVQNGYVQSPMPGEGTNTLTGEIEGCTGSPFFVEDNFNFCTHHLQMEANTTQCTVKNGTMPVIGEGTVSLGDVSHSDYISIQNCRGYRFSGGASSITIDAASLAGQISNWLIPDIDRITCLDTSCVQTSAIPNSATPTVMAGGPGFPCGKNVFQNPYMDIWAGAGTAAPPLGTALASGFVSRVTAERYPGNPNIYSARVTTSSAGIANGFICTPSFSPVAESDWISLMVPIKVASGQPGIRIFVYDGVQFNLIGGNTTTKDAWMVFRGSCRMIAGNVLQVHMVCWDGATYPTGQFFCGGLAMCFGPIPPSHLVDTGERRANVIQTIANTPDFQRQMAVSGGANYDAVSNGSSADWLKSSP